MTAAAVQRIKIRLFVEGIEIPVVACQVASAPNSPVMASIQIIPLAEGLRLLPRTLVHVFFLDDYEDSVPNLGTSRESTKPGGSAFDRAKGAKDQARRDGEEVTDDINNDFRLQRFKLLFVGEIVGVQWSKSPMNRSLVLQCADLSNYWDHAYQFNNSDLFGLYFGYLV